MTPWYPLCGLSCLSSFLAHLFFCGFLAQLGCPPPTSILSAIFLSLRFPSPLPPPNNTLNVLQLVLSRVPTSQKRYQSMKQGPRSLWGIWHQPFICCFWGDVGEEVLGESQCAKREGSLGGRVGSAAFYQFVHNYFDILATDTQLYLLLTATLSHLFWNVYAQTQV